MANPLFHLTFIDPNPQLAVHIRKRIVIHRTNQIEQNCEFDSGFSTDEDTGTSPIEMRAPNLLKITSGLSNFMSSRNDYEPQKMPQ